ncbi:MAG: protease complex subunit PrcB family protein, partial [Prevotellaceae bacterium]|jgi:hypothetical protein|nr:protease complex subunit PrcB family protein [Prevotellaceae bacterium]
MTKRNILSCILAVVLVFTVTISCNTYPITIKPVLIAEGDRFNGDKGNSVIKTQAEWDNLINVHCSQYFSNATICRQYFVDKNIDFDMFQIIAVIDGTRPQLNWSINIVSIKEYSDDIVVSIYIKAPKGPAPDALSQPYQIVKIPVTAKDVVFEYINFIPPLDLGEGML